MPLFCFFFSSRRRHTRCGRDWSSDVCSSDLEMQDEIKVTVVATGLGYVGERPVKVVDNTKAIDGTTDYNQLDRPAVMRKRTMTAGNAALDRNKAVGHEQNVDYLDIPAFLRRQAD